jgi:glutamate formiminotransferase/glutamate formiminotransferase/formiminotetrahydrofolate cyclodeaminase
VFTLAGAPSDLGDAIVAGTRVAVESVDIRDGRGAHPHVGALDVVPIVYLDPTSRGAACAQALVVADRLGHEVGLAVFLYGELAGGRTRAELRRGGISGLSTRVAAGALAPDFGPPSLSPSTGAVLVCAREPLVAFNLELAPPATVDDAKHIAALIRDGGPQGLPGVRAIGVELALSPSQGVPVAQVSTNIERPLEVSMATVAAAVASHAPLAAAELVGLAPQAALDGFPAHLEMPGFDPALHVIENVLGGAAPVASG